jgi:hypothetical protein
LELEDPEEEQRISLEQRRVSENPVNLLAKF